MSEVKPYPPHLQVYAQRMREQALEELRPALLEAQRLRAEGLTWENVAAALRVSGYISRSGAPWTTASTYLAFRKYGPAL